MMQQSPRLYDSGLLTQKIQADTQESGFPG